MSHKFLKMHGLGNDFAIFDARQHAIRFKPSELLAIADRRTGIGCDQIIVMEPSKKGDVFMRIFNADGSEVAACGNATRCVAWIMMEETASKEVRIETAADVLVCSRSKGHNICADMGEPRLEWNQIPLTEKRNTVHLGFSVGDYSDPVAVSMGNPHMIFIVPDAASVPLEEIGPQLEHYPLFPERANVSFAQLVNDKNIKLRVWERGAGATPACGTAACATLVALVERGIAQRKAKIELPGGMLEVEWDKKTNHVFMTGPVHLSYSGLYHE